MERFPDHLTQTSQVRLHVIEPLGSVQADPKTAHDLVKNQQDPIEVADLPQLFQEIALRGNHTHVPGHRLDDDRGDLPFVLVAERTNILNIVEFRQQGFRRKVGGNSR